MKRIAISQLLFALLIPCFSLTTYATSTEVSKEDVEYREFAISREDLERGTKEQCTVTVSQPYSFSTEIPKDASDQNNSSNLNQSSNNGYNNGYNNNSNSSYNNNNNNNNNNHNNSNNSNNNYNNNNNNSNKNNTNKNVQTGDEAPVALYAGIAGMGVMGMMGLKIRNKKNK